MLSDCQINVDDGLVDTDTPEAVTRFMEFYSDMLMKPNSDNVPGEVTLSGDEEWSIVNIGSQRFLPGMITLNDGDDRNHFTSYLLADTRRLSENSL